MCLLTACCLSGSSSVRVMPRPREANAVAEQHRQYIDQDLVDESALEALGRNVGAQDLQVLAAAASGAVATASPMSPLRTLTPDPADPVAYG